MAGYQGNDKYPQFRVEGTVCEARRHYFDDGNNITYRQRSMAGESL